jgi:hypothetical protein
MSAAELAFDALFYASKRSPSRVNGKWSLGAPLVPAGVRTGAAELPPSAEAAIIAFTADEGMRLELPAADGGPTVVGTARQLWQEALLTCTPAGRAGLHVPISPVEHENEQLAWGRPRVPLCMFDTECDGAALPGAPGPLHAYLSVREQDAVDAGGPAPQGALFCLLCVRRDAQALYLAHRAALGTTVTAAGRPAFCVPPFQNLFGVPGGYRDDAFAVPADALGDLPVRIVGVSGELVVVTNVATGVPYVDQTSLVHGASNRRAAVQE